MEKDLAEKERARLNKELAELWGQMSQLTQQSTAITQEGMEGNWTQERYEQARKPLQNRKDELSGKIRERMAALKVVETALGLR